MRVYIIGAGEAVRIVILVRMERRKRERKAVARNEHKRKGERRGESGENRMMMVMMMMVRVGQMPQKPQKQACLNQDSVVTPVETSGPIPTRPFPTNLQKARSYVFIASTSFIRLLLPGHLHFTWHIL